MPVTQIISVIGRSAGGGGGGGGFVPTDTGTSLGTTWTVEFIADLSPTSFWATMWGNENYFAGTGHFAYLTSTTTLNVGSPGGQNTYNLAQDVAVKSYWAFTHSDGGGIDVYRNGQLLTPDITGYVQPSNPASNTLLFGARHNNDGTGQTDIITSGTYYWTALSPDAKSAGYIASQYSSFQVPYGI